MPDLERSAQGLANLGCGADFSRSCSDFHSLLGCQDNPELCKTSLCGFLPELDSLPPARSCVVARSQAAPRLLTHIGDKCQEFRLLSRPCHGEKGPKRTGKAALGDGNFSDSSCTRALILIEAFSPAEAGKGSRVFPPVPQEVKVNNQSPLCLGS